MNSKTIPQRIVFIAALAAFAMILSYVEMLLPTTVLLPLPGFKMGLANIVTLLALTMLPFKDVLFVVLIRCSLMGLLFTGVIAFTLSLSGSLLALSVMWFLIHFRRHFSLVGISVVGACMHNVGQLTAVGFLTGTAAVAAYLPVLMITAAITGTLVGFASMLAENTIKQNMSITSS